MNASENPTGILTERSQLVEWWRGPATRDGEWIELDPERAKPYAPIEEAELMYDLAAVRKPADAVSFVGRYGLLRHGPNDEEHRERWRDFEHDASTLSGAMKLASLIRDADDDDRQRSNDAIRDLGRFASRWVADAGLPRATSDDELITRAQQVVVLIVNGGLEGVESRIAGYPGGHFGFTVDAPNLLAMAYQQLAQAIGSRAPMRECDECGRFFTVGDPRQRFCSKACGGRARQRRHAQRREGAAA